ncbi:restriction endonuclease subunit S [Sediminibacillus dalangtanensis]|uniref:Restriction endonuclease subunit S n=1 Tax=Sediminibacillus dalangtanensis TaxID=2729421 RepID=A0ABX7VVZ9_9BACI|nr:restriction endonuclease subunit S [Sediminibacillus dalangtanensis]QTN01150.1 restriction endonuclease subunit S [Sediminibacillus dalangtanensis]
MAEVIEVNWKDTFQWIVSDGLTLFEDLPEGWKRTKVKDICVQKKEVVEVLNNEEYKMVGVRLEGKGSFHRETLSGSDIGAKYLTKLENGAFLYSKLFAWRGAFTVVPNSQNGCYVSSEFPLFYVDKTKANPYYLYLFFTLPDTLKLVKKLSVGSAAVSRNRFKEERFLELEIPLPPIEKQNEIVNIWQKNRGEINKLEVQLSQKKDDLFTDFTAELWEDKGINLKDEKVFSIDWSSCNKWGVEFAKEKLKNRRTPNYNVKRITEICNVSSGGTPSRKEKKYFNGDIPWVKTTEVRNNIITETEETITELGLKNSSAKLYPSGSLIVAMYGQGATRGRTGKLGIEASTNQACAVLTEFSPNVNVDFVWYYLMSEYSNLRKLASGNNQPNLNADMIKNYEIPLPPRTKQNELSITVRNAYNNISNLEQQLEEKYNEISNLIRDLLTGKTGK